MKTTFGKLAIGDQFKLPNDPDDATLFKSSKTKYRVVGDRGLEYELKPNEKVELVKKNTGLRERRSQLHERVLRNAGVPIQETFKATSTDKNSGSYYLEKALEKLVKQGKIYDGDAYLVADEIWYQEPSSPKAVIALITAYGKYPEDVDAATAVEILKAYKRAVKADERRPSY